MKTMMKIRSTKSLLLLSFCLTLAACAIEKAPIEEGAFRPLKQEDVADFALSMERLGRPERALRILTNLNPPSVVDPATQSLVDQMRTPLCAIRAEEKINRTSPAEISISSAGAECPLVTKIDVVSTQNGLSQTFQMKIDLVSMDRGEVRFFDVTGTQLRTINADSPLRNERRTYQVRGQGFNVRGDKIVLTVDRQGQWVFGKTTAVSEVVTLRLEIASTVYILEKRTEADQTSIHRLNGVIIQPEDFDTYFSKLGFMGILSSTTDAG